MGPSFLAFCRKVILFEGRSSKAHKNIDFVSPGYWYLQGWSVVILQETSEPNRELETEPVLTGTGTNWNSATNWNRYEPEPV
jgi:hypothetical protein